MKLIFVVFAIFAIQSVLGQANDPDEIQECIRYATEGMDTSREDVQAWRNEVEAAVLRLRTQRERCDNIHRDDPPTALQERAIDNCMNIYNAMRAYEVLRLTNALRELDAEAGEILRECLGIEIERPARK